MSKKLLFAFIVGPLDILGTLVAYFLVNWWASLFANKDGWLPNWLKWFQTFDASLDTGVLEGKFPASRSIWWNRTRWLYRNPAYGWSYWVLGIPFDASEWTIKRFDTKVFYAISSKGYFCYQRSGKWFSFKLGWKAWNMWDETTKDWSKTPWGPEWRVPAVVDISSKLWGK